MLSDLGEAASVALVRIGDSLGLYKAMHEKGRMTSGEMVAATGERAFPNLRFIGYDFHPSSIEAATAHAAEPGAAGNCRFAVGTAKDYSERDFDLVTFFDCLHDMGDPVGAVAHRRQSLKPDSSWVVVEPPAGDRLEDNLNAIGRIYYAGSTMICVPTSLAQEVGAALGAQAGEKKLREVIAASGFRHVRRATETPFNIILEARR